MANATCATVSALVSKKTVLQVRCLSLREAVGLSVGAESAFLSLVAVTIILALIFRNVWRRTLYPPTSVAKQNLIRVPADLFMLSLFIADFIQALGGVLNVKWVHSEAVYQGRFCDAQGAIQQIGEPAVALATLVIAIHTFSSVWWQKGIKSLLVASILTGLTWVFVILYTAIALGRHINKFYITPTYWCWLGPNYFKEIITGEYLWFWLTLGLSLIFYVLLFFWSMGNITVNQNKWWKFSVHRSKGSPETSESRRHSLKLIAYPITYSVVIIPSCVIRFIEFAQEGKGQHDHVPSAWVLFAEGIYRLSGVLNVLLFILTRRDLLLFGDNPELSDEAMHDKIDGAQHDPQMGRLPSLDGVLHV